MPGFASIFPRAFGIGILAAASFLSACGGGDEPEVLYSRTTLVVDGVAYARRPPAEFDLPSDIYEEGAVYVSEKPGQMTALEVRLDELGLVDRRRIDPLSQFRVKVPVGWEDQWVRALRAQPPVQYAQINFAIPLL